MSLNTPLTFRDKVIDRLEQLFLQDGTLDHEFLSFPAPQTLADISQCTDEELIELLEVYGQFEG